MRRKQARRHGEVLQIGVDTFVAQLPRTGAPQAARVRFRALACLIATDFPAGGAVDRRDLFAQDRVRKGMAGCLAAWTRRAPRRS